jgi:hypothetical protein
MLTPGTRRGLASAIISAVRSLFYVRSAVRVNGVGGRRDSVVLVEDRLPVPRVGAELRQSRDHSLAAATINSEAARYSVLLVIAAPCPQSPLDHAHRWRPGHLEELVDSGEPHRGEPDHALTVQLGRCRRCGIPLLKVEPLAEAVDDPITYEVRGAEL